MEDIFEPICVEVNGVVYRRMVKTNVTLLDFIRESAPQTEEMRGSKFWNRISNLIGEQFRIDGIGHTESKIFLEIGVCSYSLINIGMSRTTPHKGKTFISVNHPYIITPILEQAF